MFAEAMVCAGISVSPVSVQSLSDLRICYIDYSKVVKSCGSSCGFHSRLIQNMLHILAVKAILFNKKLDYLLLKGMRERITAYLLDQSGSNGSLEFKIPFNREEMADFLAVDRSAMSRELGKMRSEGLIDFNKNSFVILDKKRLS
jgi:CRP-like cAMP-binding protein